MGSVLSARDLSILSLISRFGWLREDNIATFLGSDFREPKDYIKIKGILNKLVRNGWLEKYKFLGDRPAYCTLSKIGAKSFNVRYLKTKSLVTIKHDDLVERLAISLLYRESDIKTEMELKSEFVHGTTKLPDFILDKNIACEVEITEKNKKRLLEIVKNYEKLLNDNVYQKVVYYSDKKRF